MQQTSARTTTHVLITLFALLVVVAHGASDFPASPGATGAPVEEGLAVRSSIGHPSVERAVPITWSTDEDTDQFGVLLSVLERAGETTTTTTTTADPGDDNSSNSTDTTTTTTTTEEPTTTTTTTTEEPTTMTTTTTEEPTTTMTMTTTTTEEPTTTMTTTTATTTEEPTTTTTTTTEEPTTTTTTTTTEAPAGKKGKPWWVALIVVGMLLVAAAIGLLWYVCCFRPRRKRGGAGDDHSYILSTSGVIYDSESNSDEGNPLNGPQSSRVQKRRSDHIVDASPLNPVFGIAPRDISCAGDRTHINIHSNKPYTVDGVVPWTGRPPVLRGPQPTCFQPTITTDGEEIPWDERAMPGEKLEYTPIIMVPVAADGSTPKKEKSGRKSFPKKIKKLFGRRSGNESFVAPWYHQLISIDEVDTPNISDIECDTVDFENERETAKTFDPCYSGERLSQDYVFPSYVQSEEYTMPDGSPSQQRCLSSCMVVDDVQPMYQWPPQHRPPAFRQGPTPPTFPQTSYPMFPLYPQRSRPPQGL